MKAAAEAIQTGKVKIPLRCGFCAGTTLVRSLENKQNFLCQSCGRETQIETAHRLRRQAMRAFIMQGIDVNLTPNRKKFE